MTGDPALANANPTFDASWDRRHWDRPTLREPLERFALDMEKTLRRHDEKGGWSRMRVDELFQRLTDEVEELRKAIDAQDSSSVNSEAVDVANFCMMICDQIYQERRRRALMRYP